jgi:hypothetical protein
MGAGQRRNPFGTEQRLGSGVRFGEEGLQVSGEISAGFETAPCSAGRRSICALKLPTRSIRERVPSETLALETPARSATSSMVTRLRWAAEKVFTVSDLLIWIYRILHHALALKPVSGSTKKQIRRQVNASRESIKSTGPAINRLKRGIAMAEATSAQSRAWQGPEACPGQLGHSTRYKKHY